jgi:predicted transcriptional regulator
MPRFSNTLSGIRINPAQHEALHRLAEHLQTSASSIVRMAIAKFLAEHGFDLSSNSQPDSKAG